MGENELKTKEIKGLDATVKHCPFCGDEWEESDSTNNKIQCPCGAVFKVIKYS